MGGVCLLACGFACAVASPHVMSLRNRASAAGAKAGEGGGGGIGGGSGGGGGGSESSGAAPAKVRVVQLMCCASDLCLARCFEAQEWRQPCLVGYSSHASKEVTSRMVPASALTCPLDILQPIINPPAPPAPAAAAPAAASPALWPSSPARQVLPAPPLSLPAWSIRDAMPAAIQASTCRVCRHIIKCRVRHACACAAAPATA